MNLKYFKTLCFASSLMIIVTQIEAAESQQEIEALRQSTLNTINTIKASPPEKQDDRELLSYYSTLGAHLEGYILNGLSRTEEETQRYYRETYNAFLAAASFSVKNYAYSRKIADYAVKLNDIDLLDAYFAPVLDSETYENNLYVARIDYASGLERFGYKLKAEELLLDAIRMRPAVDAYEAKYSYAQLLISLDRDLEALKVVETMTKEQISGLNPSLLYLEKSIIDRLGYDSTEIDLRIEEFYERAEGAIGIDAKRPRLAKTPSFLFPLKIQRASAFSHTVNNDDSRGTLANNWWVVNPNLSYSREAINGGEVLYNEARGEPFTAQQAIAWAIRNRAMIDMNGADHYPGAESDNNVGLCRTPTPGGPQPIYVTAHKKYSCVIHGDTWTVGGTHFQMDDSHVDFTLLLNSQLIAVYLNVINNYVSDPSTNWGPSNRNEGNPNGAQEWRNFNYCAGNNNLKKRHGNVGGFLFDPGNPCGHPNPNPTTGDNFFWGRQN